MIKSIPSSSLKINLFFWLSLLLLGLFPFPRVVEAQTLTVCNSGCDYIQIQAAINAANNGDVISVQNEFHTEADIAVVKSVTIVGQGTNATIVQANAALENATTRVFHVVSGVTVTFANMTIRHGKVIGSGGGLWNDGGTVTLNDVRITENEATLIGPGLVNSGTMIINNSQIDWNHSEYSAISNDGTMTIHDTLVSYNDGHGIVSTGTAVIQDSTFLGNGGHGIGNVGELAVYNSAIQDNGTGVLNFGQLTIEQSSIYQNHVGLSTEVGQTQLKHVTINDNGTTGILATGLAEVVIEDSGIYAHPNRGLALTEAAKVTIRDTTLSNNSHTAGGGAISVSAMNGALSLTNVTIANNSSQTSGGGIFVGAVTNTPISLTNVTISGNSANEHGGGIYVDPDGELYLSNVTISKNTADADSSGGGAGGGVYVAFEFVGNPISIRNSGILRAKNSLIADNIDLTPLTNDGTDCHGDLVSGGYNLIGTLGSNALDPACHLSGSSSNLIGMDAKLGLLTANGGPTATHLPASNSPVLNAGDPAGCTDANGQPIVIDQRGTPRPQNGRCDIGAVEGFTIWQDLYLPFIVRN